MVPVDKASITAVAVKFPKYNTHSSIYYIMRDVVSFHHCLVSVYTIYRESIEGPLAGHWTADLNDAEYERECASMQVCKYASIHGASMQICLYAIL